MNKIIFISVFYITITSIYAQPNFRFLPYRPYEKLQFVNFNPDWYEVNYDSTIVSDSCDGYNYFNVPYDLADIINNNDLYSIDLKGAKWDVYGGAYVTKRNLETGALIWQVDYGLTKGNRQEVAMVSYFNEENNLEIIGLMKPEPYTYLANISINSNPRLVFTKRIFDTSNGSLLYFNNPDYNDKSLERALFSLFGTSDAIFKEGQGKIRKFNSIYLDSIQFKVAYVSTLLDANNNFMVLEKDTLATIYTTINFGDIHLTQLPTKLSEDEFLFVEKLYVDQQFKIFLRYTDRNLNVKEEYLSEVINQEVNFLSLRRISEDGQRLLFTNNVNIFDPSGERRYDILITDRKGKVLNQVRMDTKYNINYDILEWNEDNSLKLFAANFKSNPFHHLIEVLNIDSKGNIEIVRQYISEDSLRTMLVPTIKKLNNNKFLLRISEGSNYRMPPSGNIVPDYLAKATSYMLVDGSYFDIKNETKEISTNTRNVSLAPTITKSQVQLQFDEPFSGNVSIYSIEGKLVKSIELFDTKIEVLDCTSMTEGLHFVHLQQQQHNGKFPVLKFIKQ